MAKMLWVCSRKGFSVDIKEMLSGICDSLSPDNIEPVQPLVKVEANVAFAIMNPSRTLLIHGNSVVMGKILDEESEWHVPGNMFPEGSFALFRDGDLESEFITDPLASRTIWYYMDDELFLASTSQRAIILYLGNFEFNRSVIPWMLSTGSLGPEFSWDKRIKRLSPNTSVRLDKRIWKIFKNSNPISFDIEEDSEKSHKKAISKVLISTFDSLQLDYKDWVLPLSGGYDSRGILCLLDKVGKTKNLRTVTWGLDSSLKDKKNDAYIAGKIAGKFDLSHEYFRTDLSKEPPELVFDRFLYNGEGRTDHISAYMDGFQLWKSLYEDGIQGIIRGDEAFGHFDVASPLTVKFTVGIEQCADYINLKDYLKYNLAEQSLPEYLIQKIDETNELWRDRLYMQYRIPTVLAALSDLKLSYVEVLSPFLFNEILKKVRKLPDKYRTNKVLYRKIVSSISPAIPFAKRDATIVRSNIFKHPEIVKLLKKEFSTDEALKIFDEDFLKYVMENMSIVGKNQKRTKIYQRFIAYIKRNMPRPLKKMIRNKVASKRKLDFGILAFRIYIIIRMHQILSYERLRLKTSREII